jgi:hypothetical protein
MRPDHLRRQHDFDFVTGPYTRHGTAHRVTLLLAFFWIGIAQPQGIERLLLP